MKRLMLKAILTCAALTLTASASGQTGASVKIKFSDKHVMEGVVIGGRPYIALSELSRAISGKAELPRSFRVNGDTLSVSEDSAGGSAGGAAGAAGELKCKKCLLQFSGGGTLSTKLVRAKGKGGAEQVFVPLDDLAAAMGRTVQSGGANGMFNVMGPDPYGDICKKCLLRFNPEAASINPQAQRP